MVVGLIASAVSAIVINKKYKKKKNIKKIIYNYSDDDEIETYNYTSNLKIGDKVVLVTNYNDLSDTSEGPLNIGDVGLIIENDKSYKPFKIQFNDKTWWYDEEAVKLWEPVVEEPVVDNN